MDPCAPPSLHGAWWWCNRDFHSTNKKDKEITRDFINVTLGFTLLIRPKGSTDHLSVKRGYSQFSVSSSVGDFTLQAECELLIRTRDCCREARRRRHVLLFKTIIARFYGLHFIRFTMFVRVTNSFLEGRAPDPIIDCRGEFQERFCSKVCSNANLQGGLQKC